MKGDGLPLIILSVLTFVCAAGGRVSSVDILFLAKNREQMTRAYKKNHEPFRQRWAFYLEYRRF